MSVCLSVCLSASVSLELHVSSSHHISVCVCVTYVCGSVLHLLHVRSDTLCTSGFMDLVVFPRKPRLLDVASN